MRFYEQTNSGWAQDPLEAKFETLSDAPSVNYCRLCSPVLALLSLFVVSLDFLLHFD